MAQAPHSDEVLIEAATLRLSGLTIVQCAAHAGCAKSTMEQRLKHAAERGFLVKQKPVMDGFRVSQVSTAPDGSQHIQQKPERGAAFELPAGHVVKGVSALVDEEGREVVKWIKTKEGVLDPLAIASLLKDAFKDYAPAALPAPEPAAVDTDLLTLLPCNDWHVGMFAWGPETGENWDLKIAEATIGANVENVLRRSLPSAECVVLGGGDLMHADNKRNQTDKSHNALDVDGRYQKVLAVAQRMMVRTVDASLRQHKHVTVRILPGNHDEHSAVAIAHFLAAWYRNDPRVSVDTDPSLYWWYRFGNVLLGATHGHTVKLDQMPQIMAHRRAADWGATEFRYVHGFHIHHRSKIGTEGMGVVCESHQAPIPQDAWHFGAGFLSGRSLQAITYHREFGEWDRVGKGIRGKVAA